MEQRIPTALWVEAHLRQCSAEGIPIFVVHKGEYAGGLVLLKINTGEQGCSVLVQQRDIDGVLGWMDAYQGDLVEESKADGYIQKALDRDPDLWVIEVESREKRNPFEGKVF